MSLDHAVLGFRQWNIDDDGLAPTVYYNEAWKPGINTAVCGAYDEQDVDGYCCEMCDGDYDEWLAANPAPEKPEPHQAPQPGCGCGLYAWHTIDLLRQKQSGFSSTIYGAVAGWGRMFAHNTGWRAEKARILAISTTAEGEMRQRMARVVADMYEVPLVPFDMLQLQGAMYAEPMPAELIPDAPPKKKNQGYNYTSVFSFVSSDMLKSVYMSERYGTAAVPLVKATPSPSAKEQRRLTKKEQARLVQTAEERLRRKRNRKP